MSQIDSSTLFFAAIFTNNILLTNFLGLCPFLSISREIRSSIGLGAAVVFVMTFTAVINYIVYYYILVPFHLEHFRFIVFIIAIVSLTLILVKRKYRIMNAAANESNVLFLSRFFFSENSLLFLFLALIIFII